MSGCKIESHVADPYDVPGAISEKEYQKIKLATEERCKSYNEKFMTADSCDKVQIMSDYFYSQNYSTYCLRDMGWEMKTLTGIGPHVVTSMAGLIYNEDSLEYDLNMWRDFYGCVN